MTLGIAIASRTPNYRMVFVMADSRLTLEDGHIDCATKTLSLGPDAALVMAGTTTLPPMLAAECVRPFIYFGNAERATKGEPPFSLWDITQQYVIAAEPIMQEVCGANADAVSHSVLAGFFRDGSPGLVDVFMKADQIHVALRRPPVGASVFVGVGVSTYIPVLIEAARRAATEPDPVHELASVLLDVIRHEGVPGVGGGIAMGWSYGDKFQWPLLELDGRLYLRGQSVRPQPGWPRPMRIKYSGDIFPRLEREHSEQPFRNDPMATMRCISGDASGAYYESHNGRFWLRPEPNWSVIELTLL